MYRPCRRGKTAWICHCAIFWNRIIHAQVEDGKSLRASLPQAIQWIPRLVAYLPQAGELLHYIVSEH
jgi:hypothetical protein